VVALGSHATGLMSNNDDLANRVLAAGDVTNERAWRMPLWQPYIDAIKSEIGDIKNTGGRPAGSLTAAAFLSHFVADYPWVHLDIAGTAWVDRPTPLTTRGATGVGVRMLVQALRDWPTA
jgi:leucyl aminopeptidase